MKTKKGRSPPTEKTELTELSANFTALTGQSKHFYQSFLKILL